MIALSYIPGGLHINAYSGRFSIQLGFWEENTFEGATLSEAMEKAYQWIYSHPNCPSNVKEMLDKYEEISF
jgi:hypothetical protein